MVAELLDGDVNRAAEAQRQGGGAVARLRREETEGGGTEVELREGGDGAAAGKLRGGGGTTWRGRWREVAERREAERQGCGAVAGLWRGGAAGWQSGGRLDDKAETGGGGTEVERREGDDGAVAGKLRDGRARRDGRAVGRGVARRGGGGEDFFQRRGLNYPRKTRRMEVKNIEKLGSEFRQFLVKTQKIANEIFEVLGKFSRSQSKFGIAWTKSKVVSGLRPRPPAHPKKRRVSAPALKVGLT